VLRELGKMVRVGRVSAVALVELVYERVGSLNGVVNAVVALREADEALAEASALDERARRDERLGPLAGVAPGFASFLPAG